MKIIETGNGKFLFVEVPEGWTETAGSTFALCEKVYLSGMVDIKSDLEHFATTQHITEEQTSEIVDEMHDVIENDLGWMNYTSDIWCYTPLQSLSTLLKANNLTAPNYAILRII